MVLYVYNRCQGIEVLNSGQASHLTKSGKVCFPREHSTLVLRPGRQKMGWRDKSTTEQLMEQECQQVQTLLEDDQSPSKAGQRISRLEHPGDMILRPIGEEKGVSRRGNYSGMTNPTMTAFVSPLTAQIPRAEVSRWISFSEGIHLDTRGLTVLHFNLAQSHLYQELSTTQLNPERCLRRLSTHDP